jgi:hypothetical protein
MRRANTGVGYTSLSIRAEEIHAAALEQGMIDLKGYAALRLKDGLTTVDEDTAVVSMDA